MDIDSYAKSLKIAKYGDKILREKCIEFKEEDLTSDFLVLLASVRKTIREGEGIGLAAPQFFDNRRFFIFCGKVAINPEIVEESLEDVCYREGCLSIPGVHFEVYRPTTIKVRYFNHEFKEVKEDLTDLEARVFQHELDHLNGKLFTDYIPFDQKFEIQKQMNIIRIKNSE